MTQPPLPWLATFTRRWHTNPYLCHTVDPIGWHSGRMGILALHLFGNSASRDLLVACNCHDIGEQGAAGDVAWPAKQDPEFRAILDRLERKARQLLGLDFTLTELDQRRLRYLDRLDAYLWAFHHAPQILGGDGWPEHAAWLHAAREEVL